MVRAEASFALGEAVGVDVAVAVEARVGAAVAAGAMKVAVIEAALTRFTALQSSV